MALDVEPDDRFLIQDGVHRCVAAHLAGLSRVFAVIEIDGTQIGFINLEPSRIWSRKAAINRWDRTRDIHDLVDLVRSPLGRKNLFPVIVEPLSGKRSLLFTRIPDVRIVE